MSLSAEQKATVSTWIAAGDNLSAVQKKLRDEFKISMTYMDVRFLVDDLNLTLKDPAPKADANDLSKTQPASAAAKNGGGVPPPRKEPSPAGSAPADPSLDADFPPSDPATPDHDLPLDDEAAVPPAGLGSVTVVVDKVTLIPGAIAGGSVTFSDGVTGKWIIDQQYRPGFTEISQPGYRPSPADGQAFMQELSRQLQSRGF